MAAQPKRENVRILRTTPANDWLAVYAVRGEEGGRAKIEQEHISSFALCENEDGNRFASGIRENGELCVTRDDFVGHFSAKKGQHKIREEAERFVRTRAHEEGELI